MRVFVSFQPPEVKTMTLEGVWKFYEEIKERDRERDKRYAERMKEKRNKWREKKEKKETS